MLRNISAGPAFFALFLSFLNFFLGAYAPKLLAVFWVVMRRIHHLKKELEKLGYAVQLIQPVAQAG